MKGGSEGVVAMMQADRLPHGKDREGGMRAMGPAVVITDAKVDLGS